MKRSQKWKRSEANTPKPKSQEDGIEKKES